ncbi:type III secretion system export apparatus subunit SctT [Roseomonas sp. CCTCC AB2023176]|uniref:type III secretion system export apparatus subunit SctT n=1 Tax=Roseomonas sp. CCTCC AB2023176 TaxID=3342640 RepID=UPI0035D98D3B
MGAAFAGLFETLLAPMIALGLGVARLFAVFAVNPLFTRFGLTGLLRGGIALALALPLVPFLAPQVEAAGLAGPVILLLLVKEAVVGILIGLVTGVPFWAAEAAGEFIDQQRGSEAATIPDASQANESGITGTLFGLTLVAVFFLSGGLSLLTGALYDSWAIWPPLETVPRFSAEAGLRLVGLLDALFRTGLILAAPLLIALLLTELALALVGRFAPSLNIFDLAMSVKGIVFVVSLPLYAMFLPRYLRDALVPLATAADALRGYVP